MINTIHKGDCLELMKLIPDGSIDMILCDLPYGTTACKWDVIIPFDPLWEQYKRIIKSNGAIVLTASQPFTSALVMSNPKMFRYCWVWNKGVGTNYLQANKQPLKYHEDVCIFYKSLPIYNPQKTAGKTWKKVTRSNNKEGSTYQKDTRVIGQVTIKDGRMPKSIIDFSAPNTAGRFHPTQKPIALFEYLIKTYTNEGQTVLDNCAGSGTTAIACLNTNRNYILMEKEEKYFEMIQNRINKWHSEREPIGLFKNMAV